jgi:sulfite reductase alpha subunit-like flavoprotein
VLYASETGTAEDLALNFALELKNRGVRATAMALNDVDVDQLQVSRTGLLRPLLTWTTNAGPDRVCLRRHVRAGGSCGLSWRCWLLLTTTTPHRQGEWPANSRDFRKRLFADGVASLAGTRFGESAATSRRCSHAREGSRMTAVHAGRRVRLGRLGLCLLQLRG